MSVEAIVRNMMVRAVLGQQWLAMCLHIEHVWGNGGEEAHIAAHRALDNLHLPYPAWRYPVAVDVVAEILGGET